MIPTADIKKNLKITLSPQGLFYTINTTLIFLLFYKCTKPLGPFNSLIKAKKEHTLKDPLPLNTLYRKDGRLDINPRPHE